MIEGLAAALWLGILTSISPCPMATNIAAVSFIGKRTAQPRLALWAGLFYTLGRMAAYIIVGIAAVSGLQSIPGLSNFLQDYMNRLLGPLLVVVGAALLGWLGFFKLGGASAEWTQSFAERRGIWAAGGLGFVFALSFCPVSAALFFGSLIPLAVGFGSAVIYPSIYGIGTGLPVIVFAFIIAFSSNALGRAYNRLAQFERWARQITGAAFILIGVYLTLRFTLNLF